MAKICWQLSSTYSPSTFVYFLTYHVSLHELNMFSNFKVVLDAFEAQPLTEDEGKANNLEQEEEAAFSIKYLTSSNLMGLEVIFEKCIVLLK